MRLVTATRTDYSSDRCCPRISWLYVQGEKSGDKGEYSASSDNTVLSAALFLLATTCLYRKNEFAYVDGFGELTRHKNLLVETARRITCSRFYFSA